MSYFSHLGAQRVKYYRHEQRISLFIPRERFFFCISICIFIYLLSEMEVNIYNHCIQ